MVQRRDQILPGIIIDIPICRFIDIEKRRSWLAPDASNGNSRATSTVIGPTASGRRGRFIVLGSSGECLPVSRGVLSHSGSSSMYSSCDSESEAFHSARCSLDIENNGEY